jgi:hypothetical protein
MHNRRLKRATRKAEPQPRAAFQLKINLQYITPMIWRRVLVQDSCTLGELHSVIQTIMGWYNCHLHEFRMPARGFGPPLRTFGQDGEDEDATLLRDVLVRPKQVMLYEYDFGDGWLHRILLEKVLPIDPARSYPECLTGARACPIEDCGGPPGYYQMLEALQNPRRAASKELLDWAGDWNPEAFDLEFVNNRLGFPRG